MKVSKKEIEDAIKSSQSMAEAGSKLPINHKTFIKYAKELGLYEPNKAGKGIKKFRSSIPLEDIVEKGLHPQYKSHRLKIRLLNEYGWEYICSCCELTRWNEKPIPLELDHIDGNSNNNLINNLRLLCPNCHSQTENFRGRNINNGDKKVSDETFLKVLKESKNIRQALIKLGLTPKGKNYERAYKLQNLSG